MVERLVIMAPRDVIAPKTFPALRTREGGTVDEAPKDKTSRRPARPFERAYILASCARTSGT